MTDASLRPEQAGDEDGIARVVEAAFRSAAHAGLVAAIRASPGFLPDLSLVAELDGRVVGHVMVSLATIEDDDGHRRAVHNLSPLAVDPAHQRRGIGSALVREVTAAADRDGAPLVVLEGSPRYYGRFGFEHALPYGIRIDLPDWAPAEAAQVLRLRSYDPSTRGRVVYPPAFAAVGDHDGS